MPELAKTYKFVPREFPQIDGVDVPWFVHDQGPLIEEIAPEHPVHILWLPVLIDAPMPHPPEGRPDGEPLDDGAAPTL